MANRVTAAAVKAQGDMWAAFKAGISIKGYRYYEPPATIKYRYPAPGSCSLDVIDNPNLYKNDWKVPFRNSDYNIARIEQSYEDMDPLQAENYISKTIELDANHKLSGVYDQFMLEQAIPKKKQEVLFGDAYSVEDLQDELWGVFEAQQADMKFISHDFAPAGQSNDYNDDYNQVNTMWMNRGVTGCENNARIKEMFVELEYWIEEVIGKTQTIQGKVDTYKGQPKKWQILEDGTYDRDQIEKLQAAVDAPMPEQLEQWKEKHHNKSIQAPFNNANVAKWRDDARALDSADFDPQLLGYDREQKRRLFLERYEKPKELEA